MNNKNINITFKNICNSLNSIFSNTEKQICNFVNTVHKIKTRKTAVSYTDTFIYSTLYTQINKTKTDVINELNLSIYKNNNLKRTTLYEKEIKIPFEFYADIFNKITKLYYDLFNDDKIKKIIAIDGTYNNTNVYNIKGYLETSLNMGFFDINNEIPLDLTFDGIKNKNNELNVLIEYINNNLDKFNNVILILDRAYCSYNFINFLNKKKVNFVCRFRNNCSNFKKIKKNVRIIEFANTTYESVENNNINNYLFNNKKFESVQIKIKDEYKLITNLTKDLYDDEKIKDLYHKRWDVEVFFKIIKYNFKFENIKITSNKQLNNPYNIHNIKILIICILSKLFEKTYQQIYNINLEGKIKKRKFKNKKNKSQVVPYQKKEKNNKKDETIIKNVDVTNNKNKNLINVKYINSENTKNNIIKTINIDENTKKCILKPNKSLIIKGVYHLLYYIFKGNLMEDILKNTLDSFIKYSKIDTSIQNKRICKTPFKKWYIKGYCHKTDIHMMINYKLGFIDKINKNLKMKSNNITIISITLKC
jgi:hypothetical protein